MKVPIVVVNTPESIVLLYALYKIKATIVPVFPLSTDEDMERKLKVICAENRKKGYHQNYLFISDLVCEKYKGIIPKCYKVIVLSVTQSMRAFLKAVFRIVVLPKLGVKPVKFNDQYISLVDMQKRNYPVNEKAEFHTEFDNDYVAIQLYTGGTIRPKGVMLSEGNIDSASKQFYNDRFDFQRKDKIAAFMPLNHSFGLIIGTHVAISLGVVLDVIMKLDFKRLDKLFLKDCINIFGGIPNMFPAIRNNKYLEKADLSNVKYILSGGSCMGETEKDQTTLFFQNHKSKAEVHDGYGATESAGGIIYDGIPNIDCLIKIVEPKTTKELDYETVGELCLSGRQIMMGYTEKEYTDKVLIKHDDGRVWYHTGDSAMILKNGKVKILGRLDRMIKVNGEQVYLDKLEGEIDKLPFVEKSVVVKKSDPKRGFVPIAYVVLKPGYSWNEELESETNDFYCRKLTGYARPRTTKVLESFPVTNVGKIDFIELEKMAEILNV